MNLKINNIIKVVALCAFFVYGLSSAFAKANNNHLSYDIYIGKKNAPVTIYEFVSLSCPYCATNINNLLLDKSNSTISKLIEEGKIKVYIMDLPVHGYTDFLAHAMLHYAKDSKQFLNLLSIFINNQEKWFEADDPKKTIINYAKLIGLSNNTIKEYKINLDKTLKHITENANYYIKNYDVKATPTTIVEKTNKNISKDSLKFIGAVDVSEIKNAVEKLLKNETK